MDFLGDAAKFVHAADDWAYSYVEPYTHDPYSGTLLAGTPFVGTWLSAHEQSRRMDDYFRNTGVSPNDVAYPLYTYSQNLPYAGRVWGAIKSFSRRKKNWRYRRKAHSRDYYLRRYYRNRRYYGKKYY